MSRALDFYKLFHPAIPEGRTLSKLGEHGKHEKIENINWIA